MEHEPSQKAVQHIVYGDVDKDDDSLSDEYFEIVEEQEPTEEPKKQEPEQVLYAPDNRDEEGRAHRAAAKSGAKAIGMKAELGDRWSKGSELHHIGECKPCIWIWKPSGCSHGTECEFCHSCDQHELAKRRAEKDAKLRSEFRRKRALMAAARERYERQCYERWASSGHPMVPPGTPGYYPPYGGPTPYGGAAPGGHEAYGGAPPYGGPGAAMSTPTQAGRPTTRRSRTGGGTTRLTAARSQGGCPTRLMAMLTAETVARSRTGGGTTRLTAATVARTLLRPQGRSEGRSEGGSLHGKERSRCEADGVYECDAWERDVAHVMG